jgi:hypothetical protein
MRERLLELLGSKDVSSLLESEDIAEILGEVISVSDFYIPILQFLMRPDNSKFQDLSHL